MNILSHNIIAVYCCIFFLYNLVSIKATSSYCRETLDNQNLKQIDWSYLKECLQIVNGEILPVNTSKNAWRLMKVAFDAIDNIPSEAYKYMGYSLTSIPLSDLCNISMENVDVVEAFGAVRHKSNGMEQLVGFSAEQLQVIAQKVRNEWLGKNPQTYSEYDLKAMGEILCYLNVTDIEEIHTEAFKEAVEWIGLMEQCPQDRLEALANIARRTDGFGAPQNWSKLEVSIMGNIVNGLSDNEINSIAKEKLQLNHFYKPKTRKQQPLAKKSQYNSTISAGVHPTNASSTNEP